MSNKSEAPRLDRPGENALHQLAEELGHDIEFARVAAILGVHFSTLHRWRINGVLEARRTVGLATSADAIKRMVAAGSTGNAAASTPTSRTEAQRREAADAAR